MRVRRRATSRRRPTSAARRVARRAPAGGLARRAGRSGADPSRARRSGSAARPSCAAGPTEGWLWSLAAATTPRAASAARRSGRPRRSLRSLNCDPSSGRGDRLRQHGTAVLLAALASGSGCGSCRLGERVRSSSLRGRAAHSAITGVRSPSGPTVVLKHARLAVREGPYGAGRTGAAASSGSTARVSSPRRGEPVASRRRRRTRDAQPSTIDGCGNACSRSSADGVALPVSRTRRRASCRRRSRRARRSPSGARAAKAK